MISPGFSSSPSNRWWPLFLQSVNAWKSSCPDRSNINSGSLSCELRPKQFRERGVRIRCKRAKPALPLSPESRRPITAAFVSRIAVQPQGANKVSLRSCWWTTGQETGYRTLVESKKRRPEGSRSIAYVGPKSVQTRRAAQDPNQLADQRPEADIMKGSLLCGGGHVGGQ